MRPEKPYDHPKIFWDVDHRQLDYDQHAKFIIKRVFDRGDVMDIRYCRRFYSEELIKETLINAKFILPSRLRLAGAIIDLPIEKFRCYATLPSNPTHCPY